MNAAQQRQLTPVLAIIAVLLGGGLLLLLLGVGRGASWDPPRHMAPLPPPTNPNALPQPQPLAQFALVWTHPLFNPARKPTTHAADGGSTLGDLKLTGIILTPDLKMALLQDSHADKQVRLREGASLPDGSVTLVEVRPRSAVFDAASGRTELKLPAGAPIDVQKTPAQAEDGPAMLPAAPGSERAPLRESPVPEDDGLHRVDGTQPNKPENGPGGTGGVSKHAPATQQVPASGQSTPSAVERLRKNIQQRRAARAAAAHEGER